jgi:hypothetical protein
MGQSQRSLLGSMMLYKGAAADVVGGHICFLLVGGCRSCGIIVGMPGRQIRRVCSELHGWGQGQVVCGQYKAITVGGGHGCWYGTIGCGHCVGGLGAVVGVAVGMRRSCLGRKGCRWTTIAGNNCVIINVIVIICPDLEGVVVLCQMLVHDR